MSERAIDIAREIRIGKISEIGSGSWRILEKLNRLETGLLVDRMERRAQESCVARCMP